MVKPVRLAKWSSGVIVLLGVWVLSSPFALGSPTTGTIAYWNNVSSGAIILILGGYVWYYLYVRPPLEPGEFP